jgi:D-alanyl-D-alanine carboxypeptidase
VAVGQASGSNMGVAAGERLTIRDLLYGLLLPSGNDAALTIAAHVGGTVPAFVAMMNREAAALGMTHSHFANPHGLDEAGHYSSAHDLAILARRALQLPLFRQIVDTAAYAIPATATHRAHRLTNLNWFLTWYPGADGVKPGMTAAAGLCQVLSAHRHGHWLIGVLLNTPDLYTDARDLMNYGFHDFHWWPSGRAGDAPLTAIDAGSAAAPALYFPATGHRIRAGFLAFYRKYGGAAVFGPPLTDEFVRGEASIQYFSNAVFRWTPQVGVTLEPLGRALLSAHATSTVAAPG